MASVHHDSDAIQSALEESLVCLEHKGGRHDARGGRQHAVFGNDGITFNAAGATFTHSNTTHGVEEGPKPLLPAITPIRRYSNRTRGCRTPDRPTGPLLSLG